MLMLYVPTLLKPYDRHLLDTFMKVSAMSEHDEQINQMNK